MSKPVKVLISEIQLDAKTQFRAINQEAIATYAEALKEGEELPPVTLFCEDSTYYYIGDGWHRIMAALEAGLTFVWAKVTAGDLRAAQYHSLGANTDHGVNRTKEDIKNIVTYMLTDSEYASNPDRMIARHCRVSPTTVGEYRALLATGSRKKTKAKEPAVQVDTTEEELDFSPEELDSASEETAKRAKNGAPTIAKATRKAAQVAFSALVKALQTLGIYDEFVQPLSQVAERLKTV